jgi:hypothetical protein
LQKAPAGIERIEIAIVLNAIIKAYRNMEDDQKDELR